MNVRKLPSGNYQIREMKNGKMVSLTIDHKPTKFEAEQLLKEKEPSKELNFQSACDTYIQSKSNILSPTTIKSYHGIMRQIDPSVLRTKLTEINHQILQSEVNRYSATHSAKSTRNFNGFLMSVVKFYDLNVKSPKLPPNERKKVYIPTEEEMKLIYDEIKGTDVEIPIILASMGLRRSEILALTPADLNGNILTIDKALVQDENKEWVIKGTKTTDSVRSIAIPDYVAELIRKQGYVYNGYPGKIYRRLSEIEKKLGIQHFSLHKLRHFFASYLHNNQYSDKQIQALGGWKTDGVMKTVYQHEMEMEKAKQKMASSFGGLIE